MKNLIPLQVVSSKQAHRKHLKIYARIKLTEHGKPSMWKTYILRSIDMEKIISITYLKLGESDGIVPMK